MRFLIALVLGGTVWAQLSITGSAVVKQGTTPTYSASGGTPPYTFSMVMGSAGSINSSTGVYTAPSVVTPKSSPNGCQVLPNNHIFNTNMSAVPVDTRVNGAGTNNSVWWASYQTVFGGSPPKIQYEIDSPINFVNSTDATSSMVFYYGAPTANYIIPPTLSLHSENGNALYGYNVGGTDHHSIMLSKDTCHLAELYQLYPAGFEVQCPSGTTPTPPTPCTSQSGTQYDLTDFALQANATDAAGMPLYPLYLKTSELKAGAINHLLRVTMCTGNVTGGCIDPTSHQWPAQSNVAGTPNTALMPYGTILRLKSSYVFPGYTGLCPTTTCHTYVQTLITQLQNYGLIVADVGTTGAISVMYDTAIEADMKTGAENHGAFNELWNTLVLGSTNFDILNVTSLETAASGTGTDGSWGEVKYNNGSVTPADFALVKVTDNVAATATKSISLQGVAIGVSRRTEVFLAGTSATQMTAWVSGTGINTYTCSLSPSGGDNGTVTSGCLYSPTSSVSGKTKTVLTFTSTADGTKTVAQDIIIFPSASTTLYFNDGDLADYTDSNAQLWYADLKTGDPALWETSYSYDNGTPVWTNTGGAPTVFNRASGHGGDIYHSLHAPNGTYTLSLNFAGYNSAIHQREMFITSHSAVIEPRFDAFTASGAQFAAFTKLYSITVSDGLLDFELMRLGTGPAHVSGCCTELLYDEGNAPFLSGFSLLQGSPSIPPGVRLSVTGRRSTLSR